MAITDVTYIYTTNPTFPSINVNFNNRGHTDIERTVDVTVKMQYLGNANTEWVSTTFSYTEIVCDVAEPFASQKTDPVVLMIDSASILWTPFLKNSFISTQCPTTQVWLNGPTTGNIDSDETDTGWTNFWTDSSGDYIWEIENPTLAADQAALAGEYTGEFRRGSTVAPFELVCCLIEPPTSVLSHIGIDLEEGHSEYKFQIETFVLNPSVSECGSLVYSATHPDSLFANGDAEINSSNEFVFKVGSNPVAFPVGITTITLSIKSDVSGQDYNTYAITLEIVNCPDVAKEAVPSGLSSEFTFRFNDNFDESSEFAFEEIKFTGTEVC